MAWRPESVEVVDVCQAELVPPVPPFEEQAAKSNLYSMGVETSDAVVAVIAIVEVPVSFGAEKKVMVLGVGAVISIVVPEPAEEREVSSRSTFLALTFVE